MTTEEWDAIPQHTPIPTIDEALKKAYGEGDFEQFKEHILTGDCTWEDLKSKYKISKI